MDMRQYAGLAFVNIEDVRGGPRQEKIISVEPGSYNPQSQLSRAATSFR